MNRHDVDWKGFWPASPTPFTLDGALDESAYAQLMRLYGDQGMHGVVANGTTGEWFSQSENERRRVAEIAVEEMGHRATVVIGCSAFTPTEVIALARHAHEIGANGVMVTPPPYVCPTEDEIVAFYRTISDAIDLPILVYNWHRGTNVEIRRPLAERLAQIDNVVALKDSTTNRGQFIETLQAVIGELRVFGGFVSRVGLALLREIGGDGSIDGGALPGEAGPRFFEHVWRDELTGARECAATYTAVMGRLIRPDWSGVYGSPQAQLKAAMNILGQPGGYPRPPLLRLEGERELAGIREVLETTGVMAASTIVAA
jgi:dihydrodipicolinate synthase/N-acetylneuraminate lyase